MSKSDPLRLPSLCVFLAAALLGGLATSSRADMTVIQANYWSHNGTFPSPSSAPGITSPGTYVVDSPGNRYFYREDSGYPVNLARLTDGAFDWSNGPRPSWSVLPNQTTLTFALDLVTNPGGYTIDSIATYASWDSGRDGQSYTVEYSLASAPETFLTLATLTPYDVADESFPLVTEQRPNPITFQLEPYSYYDTSRSSTLVTLTSSAGPLAEGVGSLQFKFGDFAQNANAFENGGTGFQEFDVFGSITDSGSSSFRPIVVQSNHHSINGTFPGSVSGTDLLQTSLSSASRTGAPGTVLTSTDLLQTSLASASRTGAPGSGNAYFYREDSGYGVNLARLTDGVLDASSGAQPSLSVLPNQTTLTFDLDLAANPDGYTINSIATYASWDSGRDGQSYTVQYSLASAPETFLTLATLTPYDVADESFPLVEEQRPNPITFQLEPYSYHDTSRSSTLVTLAPSTGHLAEGVGSLRFLFTGYENGGTGFQEFDVIGFATVPEPSSALLVGSGFFFLGLFRWLALRAKARLSV